MRSKRLMYQAVGKESSYIRENKQSKLYVTKGDSKKGDNVNVCDHPRTT